MQENRNKPTSQQKILVSLLVIANVSVAFFLFVGYQPKEGETLKQQIPSQLLLADELIKSRLFGLAAQSNFRESRDGNTRISLEYLFYRESN